MDEVDLSAGYNELTEEGEGTHLPWKARNDSKRKVSALTKYSGRNEDLLPVSKAEVAISHAGPEMQRATALTALQTSSRQRR